MRYLPHPVNTIFIFFSKKTGFSQKNARTCSFLFPQSCPAQFFFCLNIAPAQKSSFSTFKHFIPMHPAPRNRLFNFFLCSPPYYSISILHPLGTIKKPMQRNRRIFNKSPTLFVSFYTRHTSCPHRVFYNQGRHRLSFRVFYALNAALRPLSPVCRTNIFTSYPLGFSRPPRGTQTRPQKRSNYEKAADA